MSETVGGIRYDVEVDTAGALKGERALSNSTKRMAKGYESVDASAKKANMQISKTAQSVRGASGGMRGLSGIAGQLGFQLQDVAVQAQMGTSAFTILAQQGSQVASVFGPGGAVVGAVIAVTSALAGALIPSMIDSGESVDTLREKLIKLIETATLTREQADVLIASERKTIAEREKSIKALQEEEKSLKSRLALSESTIKNYNKEDEVYKNLTAGQKKIRAQINENIATQQLYNSEIEDSTDKINTYNAVVEQKQTKATREQKDQLDSLIDSVKMQAETVGMSARGIALYTAEMLGANAVDKEFINNQFDKIDALEKEKKQMDDFLDSFKQYEGTDRAERQLDQRVQRTVETVGLDPIEQAQQQYEKELELLQEALAAQEITRQEYADREVEIEKNKVDRITAYNKMQMQNQQLLTQSQGQMLGALSNVFGTFASSMDKQNKDSFERAKKFSIAQALINTFLAVSQALGSAPPPVNFVLAAAAGAAGLATVANIRNQSFAGGREFGGPVTAGNMYRVGERGPEIYSQNGKNYMIPGQDGQVISNKDIGGGGVNESYTVNMNVNGITDQTMREAILKQKNLIVGMIRDDKNARGQSY